MIKTNEQVLFVVLNFKGWQETITCIDAVLKQSYKSFHIMLIENGSGDDSVEKLSHYEKNDKITFVKNDKNLGFAGGVNMGIRYAIDHNYPYVALLNNDAFITEDWLKSLINSLETTQASAVTGLLLSGDGKKIESTGDSQSKWGLPFPRQRDEEVEKAHDSGFVFGGTAGASVYKTALFEDIGLFDETFFAYFEDTDINFRAQLAGHKTYYEKSAIAYHDHGTTSSKIPGFTVYQTFKNLPQLFWKDVPLRMLIPTGLRFFAAYGLMYVRAVLRGQFGIATKGLLRSLALFPHALKERYRIQRKRRVSIDYLNSIMYSDLPPSTRRNARKMFRR
jgi:GT2 family glycosyltransferase